MLKRTNAAQESSKRPNRTNMKQKMKKAGNVDLSDILKEFAIQYLEKSEANQSSTSEIERQLAYKNKLPRATNTEIGN